MASSSARPAVACAPDGCYRLPLRRAPPVSPEWLSRRIGAAAVVLDGVCPLGR